MLLPSYGFFSRINLLRLISSLWMGSAALGGTTGIEGGALPYKNPTAHSSTSTLPPFVFPGAPVSGYAGLPLILMAAQAVTAAPVVPVLMKSRSSGSLSPGSVRSTIYNAFSGNSQTQSVTVAPANISGFSVARSVALRMEGIGGAMSTAAPAMISGYPLHLVTSGRSTAAGTTIATLISGTLSISATQSLGALLTQSGTPVTTTGTSTGATSSDGASYSSSGVSISIGSTPYTYVNLSNKYEQVILGSLTQPVNLPWWINTTDPGTAFSDSNTVDSISGSASGAIFPNGTNIKLIFSGNNIIIINQTGSDLVITPSTTTPGGLLISKP